MEAVQKEYWYFLVLVISLTFLKVSEQLRAPVSKVQLQDGMVLDCLCPWTGRLIMVSWTKQPDSKPLAIYHPDYGVNYAAAYEGRVEFSNASPTDGSIILTNVTEGDLGLYSCFLQMFPEGSWTKDTLVEKSGISTVSVHSDTKLVVAESQNLTMWCKYNGAHAGAVSEVTVEKLWSDQQGSTLLGVCKEQEGSVEVSDFEDRVRVNCSSDLELSVQLSSVVKEDGGLYRCNFTTDTGVQTTSIIQLTTISTQERIGLQDVLYLYIGGGVAGAFVLMSGVFLLMWLSRRRRRRREEYRIQLHPAKRRQNNAYDQGAVYDRMKKGTKHQSKNNPVYVNLQTVRGYKKRQR
ncbi:CD226 antigen isoform X1 [Astyanax mexicanus]|uniref:CD226 antigen isoform X1 n=1 Tax=Astyanax mexicanus TaxID=7994 RepID=UPI0020CAFB8F|nr:CD226 antigen isoform X1 [Astyanax mexicanus]